MLFFAYGIDTPKRLSKQLGGVAHLKGGVGGIIENAKIGHFGYNPVLDTGYETIKRHSGARLTGKVYKVNEEIMRTLEILRPHHVRKVKLVQIEGVPTKKKCLVWT